jgi:hypothetical protein
LGFETTSNEMLQFRFQERNHVMKSLMLVVTLAIVLVASSSLFAQGYATFVPAGPAPAVAYYGPAPVVPYGPVVSTAYYAPAPYYVAAPVVVPRRYYVAAPVVAAPVVVAPAYYGRPVIVRPKIYIPGEPVRNVLRAVTP